MNISNEVHEALLPLPAGPSHAEVDEHAADDSAQTGLVDVAKTLFQSATSWITAEDPESSTSTAHPLLRSAGVSAFQLPPELPEDSQEPSEAVLAPAEASVRSQSGFVAPEDGARGAVSINRTVSRRDSMQGSMARSMENAFSDLVAQPTDFAAAMETVQDILDIEPPKMPYPEPPTLRPDAAEAIAAAVEEFINPSPSHPDSAAASASAAAAAAGGAGETAEARAAMWGSAAPSTPPKGGKLKGLSTAAATHAELAPAMQDTAGPADIPGKPPLPRISTSGQRPPIAPVATSTAAPSTSGSSLSAADLIQNSGDTTQNVNLPKVATGAQGTSGGGNNFTSIPAPHDKQGATHVPHASLRRAPSPSRSTTHSSGGGGGGAPVDTARSPLAAHALSTPQPSFESLPRPSPGTGGPTEGGAHKPGVEGGKKASAKGGLINDLIVGIVNAVIAMPITAAYLPIVYSDIIYAPYLPLLTRMLFLANACIQWAVAGMSSMHFAIGQVQDLGLIFLNAMTKDIAMRLEGEPPQKVVATALLACSLSTAFLGLCLMVVGRQRLGGLVAYIPLPVVAGYLGYLGYFCIVAALAQVTGLPISSPVSMGLVVTHPERWANVVALVLCCAAIQITVNRWRSTAALPTVLLMVPLVWYNGLFMVWGATGISWADLMHWLQDHKWVEPPPAGGGAQPFWKAFELYNLVPFSWSGVGWAALIRQIPTVLVVCAVCSLGTSMDVMAVQAEVPWELDSDREITALGFGNLLAGLFAGGGPGSVIFSQSVLAIRSSVSSRMQGVTLGAVQAFIFLLPVSLVHLLPNFYYGALLAVLGVQICHEWLWNTRMRISRPEFILSWASFVSTLTLTSLMPVQGLEVGILVGIMMCAVNFAYEYSMLSLVTFTVLPSQSTSMLPYRHRQILALFQGNMVAVSVSGYIFFGSMVEIGKKLRATASLLGTRLLPDLFAAAGLDATADPELEPAAAAATAAARRFLLLDMRSVVGIDATTATSFALLRRSLDSRGVTMVITGLGGSSSADLVRMRLTANGVIAHDGAWEGGNEGGSAAGCPAFESFSGAVQWCEAHFMKVATVSGLVEDLANRTITLEDVISMNLQDSMTLDAATSRKPMHAIVKKLGAYLESRAFSAGDVLFDFGDNADSIIMVLSGSIVTVLDFLSYTEAPQVDTLEAEPSATLQTQFQMSNPNSPSAFTNPPSSPPRTPRSGGSERSSPRAGGARSATPRRGWGSVWTASAAPTAAGGATASTGAAGTTGSAGRADPPQWQSAQPSAQGKVRLAQAGPGSIVGALDFVLRRPRSSQCLAVTDGHACMLSRERHARMARDDPHIHSLLQQMMLRSSLLTTANTQQAMERAVQVACPG